MSERHFELTDETIEYCSHALHRIRATRDIPEHDVKAGDLGGFVESYDNLSDSAWVAEDAKVYRDARVFGNAYVYGNAEVTGGAEVFGDAIVYGNAQVFGNAWVYGDAKVHNNAEVFGGAQVFGSAEVGSTAVVCGCARVLGNAKVCGDVCISGDAVIKSNEDYIVFKNCWSSGRYFTWTRSNNMWKVGCFYGTGEELIKKAYKDSEKSGKCYEQIVNTVNNIKDVLK